MPEGTYGDDLPAIRGDIFLDRILGWLCLVCGLPVLGFAIYQWMQPATESLAPSWVQPAKIVLIVLGLAGLACITTSKKGPIRVALWLHIIRTVGLFSMYPWSGGPRFLGTEFVWNVVVIWYCWMRLKTIENQ